MTSKSSSRHSRRKSKPSILVSDVKYNSTCLSLDLPLSLCCDVSCHPYLESQSGLLKKSSHGSKRFRDLSDRRRCKQPWASVHNNAYKTTSTLRNYVRVRNYMQIDCDVSLDDFYCYSTSTKKSKVQEKELTLKYNAEEASSSSQVHTKVNSPNRIIEASQPSPPPHPLITVPVDTNTNALPSSPSITPAVAPVHRSTLPPLPIECCPKCRSILQEYIDNLKGWGPTDPPSGQQAVPTRPNPKKFSDSLYIKLAKNKYKQLEEDALVGRIIRKFSKSGKAYINSTELGRRLHAMAMVHAPRLGVGTMAKIISLASAGTLANLGVSSSYLPSIANMTPCASTLRTSIVQLGVDIVLLISRDIRRKQLTLICDKGDDKQGRGAGASFVKLLCWWNDLKKQVDVICFGIEAGGSKSKDAATAIDHSLTLFEYSTRERLFFRSSTTDAGGGGTNLSLVNECVLVNRAVNDVDYVWANCVLHALNLMMQCPIEEVFGSGGLKKRTFMQLLHTCYTLKSLYPIALWRELWLLSTGSVWVDMKCPVLSRWEHVGEAIQHVKKNKEEWMLMSQYIIDMNNVGTNKNDIASYLYSYLKEDILIAQLLFVSVYNTSFFDKHFQWHKQICTKSKRAGFRSIDMGVNVYLMSRDLKHLEGNWRNMDTLSEFRALYPTSAAYKIDDMVRDFVQIVRHRMNKHLTQWRKRHLPFAIAGDSLPAAYLSNWFIGNDEAPAWIPETYHSATHNTTINVRECSSFLIDGEDRANHQAKQFLQFTPQLTAMANGTATLWDSPGEQMENMRQFVRETWLKVATNSQLAERWVKDSNECTFTSKHEKMANIYAIIRSRTVMYFNESANDEHKDRSRRATKYLTKGKVGERIVKATGLLEEVNENKRDEIRGAMLVRTIIDGTIKQCVEVQQLNVSNAIRNQVYTHLTNENSQFESVRRNEITEGLASILHNDHKEDNAIQKQAGIDTTAYGRREIKYSRCLTKHMNLVRAELNIRQQQFDESMKITELRRLLKQHEVEMQTKKILDDTGLPPIPESLNTTHFKPQHCPADEWGDAFHVE